jgi:hypothetical protein
MLRCFLATLDRPRRSGHDDPVTKIDKLLRHADVFVGAPFDVFEIAETGKT